MTKPQASKGLPTPPRGLKDRSRRLFRAVTADFDLDPAGLEILTEACRALDRADDARLLVDEEGLTFRDRFGAPRPHPGLAVERDQRGLFARLLRELGLDPSTLPDSRPPTVGGRYDE